MAQRASLQQIARTAGARALRLAAALLLALAVPVKAGEFGRYEKPNPRQFAAAVAAYDAKDYRKAFDLWLPLAQHGDLAADFNIGLMLRDGRGVPRDPKRATVFFGRAAQWGHLGAQVDLAEMYYTGDGIDRNYKEAAKWLSLAARRGHYPSMYKLGDLFERGAGVARNLETAKTLYEAAARGGYAPAAERLAELARDGNQSPAMPSLELRGPIGASDAEALPDLQPMEAAPAGDSRSGAPSPAPGTAP